MNAQKWLTKAEAEGFALGAFNIDNLEIFKAVVAAAKNKKSPVIMEFSDGEAKFIGVKNIVDMVQNAREEEGVTILLNLDHSPEKADVEEAIAAGFEMVHFDGSKKPYEENLEICKKIVPKVHAKGLTVEGEIDHIAGSSEVHEGQLSSEEIKQALTDPARAKEFVDGTGIDIFAAFFGNYHGIFEGQEKLVDFDLLKRIREELPNTFLSMHGGSGISDEQVRKAIDTGGIVKVNINTELRKAFRETTEKTLSEKPDEYAVYKLMPEVISAIQEVVEHKINIFGSAGKAS
jgi:fructose-bisphosphate aldolase class II